MAVHDFTDHSDDELWDEINAIRAEQERRAVLRDTPGQILASVEHFLAVGGSLDDLALVRPDPTSDRGEADRA